MSSLLLSFANVDYKSLIPNDYSEGEFRNYSPLISFINHFTITEDKDRIIELVKNVNYAVIVLSFAGICVGTLLIVGAVKVLYSFFYASVILITFFFKFQRRIMLLKIYLVILFVSLFLLFIGIGFLYVFHWPLALYLTIIGSLDIYLMICINSYLQTLIEAKTGGTNVEFKAVPQA